MKTFKKIISVVLIIAILSAGISISVYAKDDNEIVARVYVCERTYDYEMRGHSWLYFENLTNHNLQVGVYSLPPKQGVSVGTYGHSLNGRGVYYNVEAYRSNHSNVTDMVYISKDLTQDGLDRMSNKITRSGYWTYLLNCAFFSFTTWDVTSGKFLVYLILPILAKLAIIVYPDHQVGLKMYYPKKDQVFKQEGYGDNATLVPTDPYGS